MGINREELLQELRLELRKNALSLERKFRDDVRSEIESFDKRVGAGTVYFMGFPTNITRNFGKEIDTLTKKLDALIKYLEVEEVTEPPQQYFRKRGKK